MSASVLLALAFLSAQSARPSFDYTRFGACENLSAWAGGANSPEMLTISVALPPAKTPYDPVPPLDRVTAGTRRYDLAESAGGAQVAIELSGRGRRPCSDVINGGPTLTWRAIAGRLTITVGEPDVVSYPCSGKRRCYGADVILEDVEFEGPSRDRLRLPKPLTFSVVGGYRFEP
jgi:hypothetical protein